MMLYATCILLDSAKKWTEHRSDWGEIHSQLEVFFADRLPDISANMQLGCVSRYTAHTPRYNFDFYTIKVCLQKN